MSPVFGATFSVLLAYAAGLAAIEELPPATPAPPSTVETGPAGADASDPEEDEPNLPVDVRASGGPYGALFDGGYGGWVGGRLRLWVLDVTGERGASGFFEVVNLHWRGGEDRGVTPVDSLFLNGRVLWHLNDSFYAVLTAAGTVGDLSFPRLQTEVEFNFSIPSHPALVVSAGGGNRNYERLNRPSLSVGFSYSLPKAAVSYRYWYDGTIAVAPSHTHLATLIVGERTDMWLRVQFLWGDEGHPTGSSPTAVLGHVGTKSVGFWFEKWLLPNFGLVAGVELAENRNAVAEEVVAHRWQLELRPFFTF